jgi:hypothetical protein
MNFAARALSKALYMLFSLLPDIAFLKVDNTDYTIGGIRSLGVLVVWNPSAVADTGSKSLIILIILPVS